MFSAVDADGSSLSVAPPEAFGFLGDDAGAIESSAQRLFVGPKKSISIIGGSVFLEGSTIEASSGRINVVGIGGSGQVRARDGAITSGTATGRVVLAGGSILQPGGSKADGVRLRAGKVRFDNSDIRPNQRADEANAGVGDIKATTFALDNGSAVIQTLSNGGAGVAVGVQAEELIVRGDSALSTESVGPHDAGDVIIDVAVIRIDGRARPDRSTSQLAAHATATGISSSQL